MQSKYDERYLDAVEGFAKRGFEMHLLSGRVIRQAVESSDSVAMTPELEAKVHNLCSASLAVSAESAEQFSKELQRESNEQVLQKVGRAKLT